MTPSTTPLRLVPAGRGPREQAAPRIAALASLPVFLKLAGRRAVVSGGSDAALWKAELLAAAGAHVEVYAGTAPQVFAALGADPPDGSVTVHARGWTSGDLPGAAIAIADATGDDEAAAFADAARTAGVPFNIIDRPAFCELQFGAIVNRSPLVVSISTDGAAPVFAQAVRARIEASLPQPFKLWAEAARAWRPAIQRLGLPFARRRRFWEAFSARAFDRPAEAPTEALRDGLIADATALPATRFEKGRVTLVGAGPGDPDLLTLKAVRALQSADVILHDDLVGPEVLDFARREAKRVLVGKTGHGPACRQDEVNALMIHLAKGGRHVVRLKGGDPGIFGRAAEEIEACRQAGIEVTIIPGITAIHMSRETLGAFRDQALASGLLPHAPAIAISSATRQNQHSIVSTVSELSELVARLDPPGPLLVLIGRGLATEAISERERTADAPQRPFVAGSRA